MAGERPLPNDPVFDKTPGDVEPTTEWDNLGEDERRDAVEDGVGQEAVEQVGQAPKVEQDKKRGIRAAIRDFFQKRIGRRFGRGDTRPTVDDVRANYIQRGVDFQTGETWGSGVIENPTAEQLAESEARLRADLEADGRSAEEIERIVNEAFNKNSEGGNGEVAGDSAEEEKNLEGFEKWLEKEQIKREYQQVRKELSDWKREGRMSANLLDWSMREGFRREPDETDDEYKGRLEGLINQVMEDKFMPRMAELEGIDLEGASGSLIEEREKDESALDFLKRVAPEMIKEAKGDSPEERLASLRELAETKNKEIIEQNKKTQNDERASHDQLRAAMNAPTQLITEESLEYAREHPMVAGFDLDKLQKITEENPQKDDETYENYLQRLSYLMVSGEE